MTRLVTQARCGGGGNTESRATGAVAPGCERTEEQRQTSLCPHCEAAAAPRKSDGDSNNNNNNNLGKGNRLRRWVRSVARAGRHGPGTNDRQGGGGGGLGGTCRRQMR